MARKKKIEPTNAEAVNTAAVTGSMAAETTPAAIQESVSADAAEEAIAVSEMVAASQKETEKPVRRHGGRRPKSDSSEATERPARKRGVRKPKDSPAESAETTKKRGGRKAKPVEEKPVEKAEKKSLLPRRSKVDIPDSLGVFVQYQGGEADMSAVVEAVKADFMATSSHKRISSLKLYVKPEEHTVYYVANDSYNGKISF